MNLSFIDSFWHLIFVGFVALLPPVNPIGTAIIVEPFLKHLSQKKRIYASLQISIYCLLICSITITFGSSLLTLFGISIPVVQVAGGILICRMGWEVLSEKPNNSEKKPIADSIYKPHHGSVRYLLFYPLAFPTTTGAGTISVLLTLSANNHELFSTAHLTNLFALALASLMMCLLVFVCFSFSPFLFHRLSEQGQQILGRLSGFLTFCIGIQILVNGISAITRLIR